jgi:hypothetical protein
MSPEPDVKPLPYQRRTWFFRLLLAIFICTVPAFMFYATGYRLSLTDTENIVSVGGIFVGAEYEDTTIFLNDEPVENYRLFQRAAYIQNLPAGVHQLHVQGEGLHTWVKRLPVYPHIVTEANAFNYPLVPQVRLVSEYQMASGTQIIFAATGTAPLGEGVQHRVDWQATTTTATSSFEVNDEFPFVAELFATNSTSSAVTLRSRIQAQLEDAFAFSSELPTSTEPVLATTTKRLSNRSLYETEDGLFVRWEGGEDTPYYFCVNTAPMASTTSALGAYVANNIASVRIAATELSTRGDFTCRDTIAINTFDRPVYYFDFMPQEPDVVLAHLSDGIYAIEMDDRGWQNTQLLYESGDVVLARTGDQLFISDDGYYAELLLTLADSE